MFTISQKALLTQNCQLKPISRYYHEKNFHLPCYFMEFSFWI